MADDVIALIFFPTFLPYQSTAWRQAIDGGVLKKKALAADLLPEFALA